MSNKNIERATIASRIGQRRQVVIPKRVLDALKLREGDYMEVTAEDTLTKIEAATVRRGEARIKAGRSKAWSAVKYGVER